MIINKDYNYIFVGLPFSASSAISKELIEQYDGKSILKKHSNIPSLKNKDLNLDDYFIFAVYRDPIDIAFSHFTKLKFDEKGVYTNPKYYVENGGHVTKKARQLRKKIIDNEYSFEEYLENKSRWLIPYDNLFSVNKSYLSFVINFEDLVADFEVALKKIGIKPIRKLPKYNKTKTKKKSTPHISDILYKKIFATFYNEHKIETSHNRGLRGNALANMVYYMLKPLRKVKMIIDDMNRSDKRDALFSDLSKKSSTHE